MFSLPANIRAGKIAHGLIGLAISVALIVGLLSFVNLDDFHRILGQTDWLFVVSAAFIYFLTYVIRSYRFALILNDRSIVFFDHLMIVSIHTFFNHILPFRSGELSYIYLRKKYHGLSYGSATSSLFSARLFDVISLFAIVCMLGMFSLNERLLNQSLVISILIILLVIILFFALIQKMVHKWLEDHSGENYLPETLLNRVSGFFALVFRDMYSLLTGSRFLLLLFVSLVNWASVFTYFYLLFCGFKSALTFRQTLIPSLGAILGNLLPVNGLGSLGTFEAGMSAGQTFSGVDLTTSATISFLIHFHAIVIGAMYAVFFLLINFFLKKSNKDI
ncbi:lysylphosphatidylglycerol synthase transmembrane domain-containing protein [Thermodesulfobacteriota bacterium]